MCDPGLENSSDTGEALGVGDGKKCRPGKLQDDEMSKAESQYDTDNESQCENDTHHHHSLEENNFSLSTHGYAIRRALRASKISKAGIRLTPAPVRANTRGQ